MKLGELLQAVGVSNDSGVEISGICNDSRQVRPGDLFCAVTGDGNDGLRFLSGAIEAGAAALAIDPAVQNPPARPLAVDVPADWPVVEVENLNQRLGELASALHQQPSKALRLLGVTGTNGKTTVAHLYAQAAGRFGQCGQLGTLGYGFAPALEVPTHTTPLAPRLQQLLAQMRDAGADEVVMEVSSHALVQNRVGGCRFHTAIFTNISRDHLDYHGDMQSYAAAKSQLFDFPGLKVAVINADDSLGKQLLARLPDSISRIAFTLNAGDQEHLPSEIHLLAAAVKTLPDGLRLSLSGGFGEAELRSSLMGRFNAANLLAALGGLLAAGHSLDDSVAAVAAATAAPGRMECLTLAADVAAADIESLPTVLIDYAHTPAALINALKASREHCGGQLWCVFGCGGDRDVGKRPEMGAAAERYADFTVLTNDNPRSESPVAIADAICAGMRGEPTHRELDRAAAIGWAIARAEPGDTVLIAGKGHENYQETNGQRQPFLDHDAARAALVGRLSAAGDPAATAGVA